MQELILSTYNFNKNLTIYAEKPKDLNKTDRI